MNELLEEVVPRGVLRIEIKKRFPNRERLDCPARSILREMAEDPQAHLRVFYHVLQCGACVQDFERYQRMAKQRRIFLKGALLAAAGILTALGIWWCISAGLLPSGQEKIALQEPAAIRPTKGIIHRSGDQTTKDSSSARPTLNAAIPVEILEPAPPVVDYTIVSPTRSMEAELAEPKTLGLRRERMKLRIHLPLGSEEGTYEVRLQRKSDNKVVIRRNPRASKSNDFTLTIEDDFSKLRSGAYSLEIFPPGYMGQLPGYPVKLVDKK